MSMTDIDQRTILIRASYLLGHDAHPYMGVHTITIEDIELERRRILESNMFKDISDEYMFLRAHPYCISQFIPSSSLTDLYKHAESAEFGPVIPEGEKRTHPALNTLFERACTGKSDLDLLRRIYFFITEYESSGEIHEVCIVQSKDLWEVIEYDPYDFDLFLETYTKAMFSCNAPIIIDVKHTEPRHVYEKMTDIELYRELFMNVRGSTLYVMREIIKRERLREFCLTHIEKMKSREAARQAARKAFDSHLPSDVIEHCVLDFL